MRPRWALILVSLCAFSILYSAIDTFGYDLSRGRQILLDRGLQIQALLLTPINNPDRWHESNFTTPNFWESNDQTYCNTVLQSVLPGTQWSRAAWVGGPPITLPPGQRAFVDNLVGLQYADELNIPDGIVQSNLDNMKNTYAYWRETYPHILGYTNFAAWGTTPAELRSYMEYTQPDMISFDSYPHFDFPVAGRERWYRTMQMYRTEGLAGIDGTGQKPIPYAQFLDLYRPAVDDPLPSESFVRLQQSASWAFGYTFVSAFVYTPSDHWETYSVMFSDATGDNTRTPVFDYVAETNRQSRNLGPALVRLVSADIRLIYGKVNNVTNDAIANISPWTAGGQSTGGYTDYITGITPLGIDKDNPSTTNYSDMLVGYLTPLLADNSNHTFVDGLHFMIVNGAAGTPFEPGSVGDSAEDLAEWYHITFDFTGSDFDSLVRLSRDTGRVELVTLTHTVDSQYYLDLRLPGGTGDLFAFWNSAESLPTVPEAGSLALLLSGLPLCGAVGWWWRKKAT